MIKYADKAQSLLHKIGENGTQWTILQIPRAENKADGIAKSDRKSTRLNSSHSGESRMPSSA